MKKKSNVIPFPSAAERLADAERKDALKKAIDKRLDKFIAECERKDDE